MDYGSTGEPPLQGLVSLFAVIGPFHDGRFRPLRSVCQRECYGSEVRNEPPEVARQSQESTDFLFGARTRGIADLVDLVLLWLQATSSHDMSQIGQVLVATKHLDGLADRFATSRGCSTFFSTSKCRDQLAVAISMSSMKLDTSEHCRRPSSLRIMWVNTCPAFTHTHTHTCTCTHTHTHTHTHTCTHTHPHTHTHTHVHTHTHSQNEAKQAINMTYGAGK